MNPIQNVELILSQYKQFLADYDTAVIEIFKLQRQKQLHETGQIETDTELISGMALNAPTLSHIPKSITNKFSSVTENVALNYLQFLRYSKVEVDKIETMIDEKCRIVTNCYERILLVEHMLNQLNEHERYIIEKIYFDSYGLAKTKMFYNKQYPEFYVESKNSIRNMKFEALQKMATRIKKQ